MSQPNPASESKIPLRWLVAMCVVILLSLVVILLSLVAASQYRSNNRQDVALAKAQAAIAITVKIRQAEKRSACSRSIAGANLGNALLGQIQDRLNSVAEVATSPKVKKALLAPLPMFPVPKPGCPKPKNPKNAGS